MPGVAEQSLRTTLRSLPSVQVVGWAAGCLTALQMVRDWQADLVVLDANLPLAEVQEFLRLLRQQGRGTRALVLAATNGQVHRARAAGADAALRWDASIQELSAALADLQRTNRGSAKRLDGETLPGG